MTSAQDGPSGGGSHLPRLGQVVRSAAGRDRGRHYLVVRIIAPHFVSVSDGRARTASNPKQKNVRHLDFCPRVAESLARRLEQGESIEDEEIRSFLATQDDTSADCHTKDENWRGSAPGGQG